MAYFVERKWNFHAFHPIPENHNHWYFRGKAHCEEFERYFRFNNAFTTKLNVSDLPDSKLCQFLIIIEEDGKKFKSLKRHIRTHYDLSPEEYREKWGLGHDYPMVAPAYAEARSRLAREMGLGRKKGMKVKT